MHKQGELDEFKAFAHRLRTPYAASKSTSPLWYSIQRGPAYIIALSSYSSFGKLVCTDDLNVVSLLQNFPKLHV